MFGNGKSSMIKINERTSPKRGYRVGLFGVNLSIHVRPQDEIWRNVQTLLVEIHLIKRHQI